MLVGLLWKPYIGQAAGGEWDMMDMNDRMGEQATVLLVAKPLVEEKKD
jgi:hypothetical protein